LDHLDHLRSVGAQHFEVAMMLNVAGQHFLVIGAGKTGQSVAAFLARYGARTRLVERTAEALSRATLPAGIETRVGDSTEDLLRGVDVVIPSPGVARTHGLLRRAVSRGVPVMSEIELAARVLACPILAVTGTNGKSTTTVLLGSMLKEAGVRVFVGGNLGTPLIDACAAEQEFEAAVVEVSSFQLEWVYTFRPQVALLLNMTPDHLDRYPNMDEYQRAKAALLAAQQPGDVAVLNRDDPWVWEQRRRTRAATISFGREPVEFGSFVDGNAIIYWGPDPLPRRFTLDAVMLQGAHNRENMMAAVTAAAIWGVPDAAIQRALENTRGLPHRLALVGEHDGVCFYDDSKGTNVGAMEKSVASFSGNVILLAGGYDKGGDFTALTPLLRTHVKHLVLFGAAGPTIQAQLGDAVPASTVPDLAAAVRTAAAHAGPGDTVLLSPGCASFDEFTDYAARGRRFRELVEAL
jgi:UDP-N-acetylmuramoylalanine--D-glutamate ligase